MGWPRTITVFPEPTWWNGDDNRPWDNEDEQMKISNAFPSKYLRAADLQDRQIRAVMKLVEMENIGDDDKKPVLYFMKGTKGLVLNKTNSKAISNAYGDDTDNWEGKEVILFPAMVDFRGDSVEAIRVKIPKPAAPPAPAPQTHDELNPPTFDDEIPF